MAREEKGFEISDLRSRVNCELAIQQNLKYL